MRAAEDEPEPLFRRANMTNLSRSLLVALIVSYCALVGVDIKLPFVLIAGLYGLLMIMSFFSVRIEGVLFASSSAKLNRRLAVFAVGVALHALHILTLRK